MTYSLKKSEEKRRPIELKNSQLSDSDLNTEEDEDNIKYLHFDDMDGSSKKITLEYLLLNNN